MNTVNKATTSYSNAAALQGGVSSYSTSVVIACYNGERYLEDALRSVYNQTVPVREVLIVDDGSHAPITAPLWWQGPPLRIYRTPNRGPSAARNLALAHASGTFIAFIDADDLWHPQKIERQEKALTEAPEAVGCYTRCVEAPGFFGFGPYPPTDVDDDEFLLVFWYNSFFPTSAVMVRKSAFHTVGVFREELRYGEDHELWLRLLTQGPLVQIAEPLCWYRRHDGQATTNTYRKLLGGKTTRAVMIAEHRERLIKAGLPANKLWDTYRNELLLCYFRRQLPTARRLLWDFWKDHPADLRVLSYAIASLLPASLLRFLRGETSAEPLGGARPNTGAWKQLYQRIPRAVNGTR